MKTKSNVEILKREELLEGRDNIFFLVDMLEDNRGMFMSSGAEYPGRYSRWETGFVAPPVEVIAFSDRVIFKSLNERGDVLIKIFEKLLKNTKDYTVCSFEKEIAAHINFSDKIFPEEERSKQPSVLSPVRDLLGALKIENRDEAGPLGFYGAFGYDLLFQFDKIPHTKPRDPKTPVMRLFFPDKIYTYDRKKERGTVFEYDFKFSDNINSLTTQNLPRAAQTEGAKNISEEKKIELEGDITSDLTDEEYSCLVEKAKDKMREGIVFELVLRRKYSAVFKGSTSALFSKMTEINPSPYQFYCQFGDEQLVGTSPEMFVRVTNNRVETCPISGTIRRKQNVIEDAEQIKKLLNSKKDECELTMCTDVDRSDKSRICKSGTIRLLGRRQIEKYKGLFHTVDHVEGILRDDMTSIDSFLSHMWAVTLMGSPKSTAAHLIEDWEDESREYYGGAVGAFFINGDMNTGITIRTIHIKNNTANYSVGASLVYDSEGEDEARETRTKATSFFNIFKPAKKEPELAKNFKKTGEGLKIVVIDNQDSFVNNLSDYFRVTGADVITYRAGVELDIVLAQKPDLVLHSPGPKLPKDFNMHSLIKRLTELDIAQFGVCLGLQGIVETFGGKLKKISPPHQGKVWTITHNQKGIFKGLENPAHVGAYHSWVADESCIPECIEVTSTCEKGYVMAIAHREKPLLAVQFHPESIMSAENDFGHRLIENVVEFAKEYKAKRGRA